MSTMTPYSSTTAANTAQTLRRVGIGVMVAALLLWILWNFVGINLFASTLNSPDKQAIASVVESVLRYLVTIPNGLILWVGGVVIDALRPQA